jgi:hypothetical protein
VPGRSHDRQVGRPTSWLELIGRKNRNVQPWRPSRVVLLVQLWRTYGVLERWRGPRRSWRCQSSWSSRRLAGGATGRSSTVGVPASPPAVCLRSEQAFQLHQAPDSGAVGAEVGLDVGGCLADGSQVDAEQLRAPFQRRRDRPAHVRVLPSPHHDRLANTCSGSNQECYLARLDGWVAGSPAHAVRMTRPGHSERGPQGPGPPGSRWAATGVRNDRGARPKTVEDHDRRSASDGH